MASRKRTGMLFVVYEKRSLRGILDRLHIANSSDSLKHSWQIIWMVFVCRLSTTDWKLLYYFFLCRVGVTCLMACILFIIDHYATTKLPISGKFIAIYTFILFNTIYTLFGLASSSDELFKKIPAKFQSLRTLIWGMQYY